MKDKLARKLKGVVTCVILLDNINLMKKLEIIDY